MHRVKVKVLEDALDANATIAQANRGDFDRAGVTVVNVMSAPGAGKTSLLERVLPTLEGVRPGVLEGDVQGSMDADRLAALAKAEDGAKVKLRGSRVRISGMLATRIADLAADEHIVIHAMNPDRVLGWYRGAIRDTQAWKIRGYFLMKPVIASFHLVVAAGFWLIVGIAMNAMNIPYAPVNIMPG